MQLPACDLLVAAAPLLVAAGRLSIDVSGSMKRDPDSVLFSSCQRFFSSLGSSSHPLSLIMCASSMMYLPSLYFWLVSKACSCSRWRRRRSD